MNIGSASIKLHSGFTAGAGGAQEVLAIACFVIVGLILLFAAGRLCGRRFAHSHAADYMSTGREITSQILVR